MRRAGRERYWRRRGGGEERETETETETEGRTDRRTDGDKDLEIGTKRNKIGRGGGGREGGG